MYDKFMNFFYNKKSSGKYGPMIKDIGPLDEKWINDKSVSEDLKSQWLNNGFSILRNVFTKDEIAAYNLVVEGLRASVDDGKDENGFGDRIGQLHQKFPQ